MPQTILHAVSSLDRFTSAEQLIALLSAWDNTDWQHRVVVLGSPQAALSQDLKELNVEVDFLWQRWRLDPTTVGRIAKEFLQQQPQVVHTWDSSALHYVQAAAVVTKLPRLVAEWDLDILDEAMPDPTRLLPVARPLATFVAPTRRVDQWLRGRFPDSRVRLIFPSTRCSTPATTTRPSLFDEFSLPDDAKFVGTACPLRVEFGVKELIWAADMLRVLHPSLRYLIAGDGPERRHLEYFASTAARTENVLFLGDTDRWPQVLPHLDVYWQGSAPMASSPTMLIDAMAAGVPVVASDTPQHRDCIEHERTGYLVGYDARAERTRWTDELFTTPATAQAISTAATEHATRNHSPEQRVAAYQQLYLDLLG